LRDGTALEYVLADAGTGLRAGIAVVPQRRRTDAQPALENGLDVFHTTQEARRVLRLSWDRVERPWEQAEAASRRVAQARRQGPDARGVAVAARSAWRKAEAAFRDHERSEVAWGIAPAARAVFRPEGPLNDRGGARAQIAWALPGLSGREWSQVRGFLQAETALTFLDRPHRQWEAAVPEDDSRAELVPLWWLRRQRPRASTETGASRGPSNRAVSRVLRQAVRARSAVECMNSVLRMHQSRHKTVTQGLLDLKRLLRFGTVPLSLRGAGRIRTGGGGFADLCLKSATCITPRVCESPPESLPGLSRLGVIRRRAS
jgi:hypothetical protein